MYLEMRHPAKEDAKDIFGYSKFGSCDVGKIE
jgi:hypothetical protein